MGNCLIIAFHTNKIKYTVVGPLEGRGLNKILSKKRPLSVLGFYILL